MLDFGGLTSGDVWVPRSPHVNEQCSCSWSTNSTKACGSFSRGTGWDQTAWGMVSFLLVKQMMTTRWRRRRRTTTTTSSSSSTSCFRTPLRIGFDITWCPCWLQPFGDWFFLAKAMFVESPMKISTTSDISSTNLATETSLNQSFPICSNLSKKNYGKCFAILKGEKTMTMSKQTMCI